MNALPKSIYRVKGIVKTSDVPEPILINYAFGNVSYEEVADYEEASILIFIGDAIDEDVTALSEQFDFVNLPRFRVFI